MKTQSRFPSIRFSFRENRIYINHAALRCLENPKFIELIYEDMRRLFLIRAAENKTRESIVIKDEVYASSGEDCRISRKVLTEAFRRRLGWETDGSYRIEGEYAPKLKTVVFELLKAVKINMEISE